MIPLEKQITSIEISRRLKALGVKQAALAGSRSHHAHFALLLTKCPLSIAKLVRRRRCSIREVAAHYPMHDS